MSGDIVHVAVADVADIALIELRIHGERQNSARLPLGVRKITNGIAELRICFLQMQRNGIMQTGRNSGLTKIRTQTVPVIGLDHEQVIDAIREFSFLR